jgi:hypothetical protein
MEARTTPRPAKKHAKNNWFFRSGRVDVGVSGSADILRTGVRRGGRWKRSLKDRLVWSVGEDNPKMALPAFGLIIRRQRPSNLIRRHPGGTIRSEIRTEVFPAERRFGDIAFRSVEDFLDQGLQLLLTCVLPFKLLAREDPTELSKNLRSIRVVI